MRKRRLPALLLTLTLVFSLAAPAAAYDPQNLIPQKKTYSSPFPDTQGTWCDGYVQTCYASRLLDGKATDRFAPKDPLTYAQIFVITARLHELLNGGDGKFDAPAQGQPWYQPAADYLAAQVSGEDERGFYLLTDLNALDDIAQNTCDRYDFVWYLSVILPDSALAPINSIDSLPDVSDPDILRFYNAGILNGSDEYGTFNGLDDLNRGQAAAMLARIIAPAQRVKFRPKALVASQAYLGLAPDTPILTVDGYTINAETYTYYLLLHLSAVKMADYFSFYETYPEYFEAYLQDDTFDGDFGEYLLEKHGINVDTPIAWDTPDKGGMTPAQKVKAETLKSVSQLAVVMSHQEEYPLTQQQKQDIQTYVENTASPYGFSKALSKELSTMMTVLENITDSFSLTPKQLDRYLTESGYVYGQYVAIYRGAEGTHVSDQEARKDADTVCAQMSAHLDDAEYLEYLIWKYSDDYTSAPSLIPVSELSLSTRQALEQLSSGQVSPVLVEDDRYLVVLKLDPSQDETVAHNAALIPAEAQVAKWAEDAVVTTAPAYGAVNIAAVDNTYSARNQ